MKLAAQPTPNVAAVPIRTYQVKAIFVSVKTQIIVISPVTIPNIAAFS
jgi:hypothetical protein